MDRDNSTGTFIETHGLSHTYEYGIWGNMLYRCRTETAQQYRDYGKRGIKVCSAWLSFENFIEDMGFRPTKAHSLDRIDPDGPYCKENCRWATAKTQARNRRNSVKVNVNGVDMQLNDFCEAFGLKLPVVKNRLRRGWDVSRILNTPVRGYTIVNS